MGGSMSSDAGDTGDDRSGDANAGGGNMEVGVEGIAGGVNRTPNGEGEMLEDALIGQGGGEVGAGGSEGGESGSGNAMEEQGAFTDGEDDDGDDGSWEDEESGSDDDDAAALPAVPRDPERGCEHYGRGCKLVAPCCGEVHWCRFCHNAKWENCLDESKRHTLDRHAVTEVVCHKCELRQPVSNLCIGEGCGTKFGEYFCGVCNFFDDDMTKKPFHCGGCGICRVGGRDKFFHCDTCGCCYSVELQNNHKCVEDSMKQNCPICQENLFNSVVECRVLRCGHTMHKPCYNSLMEQARWPTCPLCSVSIIDSTLAWHQLDIEIANTPMPEEYRDQIVQLLCNDCNTKGEVPLHFLGLKCPNTSCGSYNTARL